MFLVALLLTGVFTPTAEQDPGALPLGTDRSFSAEYVEERSYGDCKALSNYMKALLKAVGIPSYPVLIYRGFDPPPLLEDFPTNQFNHAVLAVPTPVDTLWLEATDPTAPFGHVAADIENRLALWTSPQGGPRTQPVDLTAYTWHDTDTFTFTLPKGYDVEAVPDSVTLSTDHPVS